MAETPTDIIIDDTEYISLNTLTGITTGNPFTVINKGSVPVRLIESSSKPDIEVNKGIPLTTISEGYAVADIDAGSLEVWARSLNDKAVLTVTSDEVV